MLVAWMEFLKNPESEKVRSLELTISEIREAKDELIRISNDKKQQLLYEMRSKTLKDKNSALNEAERKGIEKGIGKGIEKVAKNLLDMGIPINEIILATGLSENEILNIKNNI